MERGFIDIDYPFKSSIDWIVFGVVLVVGFVFAWYVYTNDMLLMMVDQYSHLAISRQISDSMTPGLSQLGFWPPLVHIFLAPFAAFDALYFSGLAAAAGLVPVLALGSVFLFQSVVLLTSNRTIAAASVAAFVLNPYILYYSVTPMSDMLYVALMFMALYFFVHWWLTDKLLSLVWLGFACSLATMARFEGFFLVAFVGLAVIARLLRDRVSYHKIEGTSIIFGMMAGAGIVFIVFYSLTYAGDPLAFMNNEWGAYSQQRSLFLPTEHNIIVSLQYLLAASKHMISLTLVILAIASTLFLVWVLRGRHMLVGVVALILASPFIFDIFALWQGSAVIYLPELPPYDPRFFNERYGLYWIGFAIVMPALLASYLYTYIRTQRWYFEPIAVFAAGLVMATTVLSSYGLFSEQACADCFDTVQNSLQRSPPDHGSIVNVLKEEYDGGRILMTRALHNEIAVEAGIPLRNYVLEANEHYFEHALTYPWLFADWVVMQNVDFKDHTEWSVQNEKVSAYWGRDEEFKRFYEPMFVGGATVLYRLRHEEVQEYVEEYQLEDLYIPTLASGSEVWDVDTVFADIHSKVAERNAQTGHEVKLSRE